MAKIHSISQQGVASLMLTFLCLVDAQRLGCHLPCEPIITCPNITGTIACGNANLFTLGNHSTRLEQRTCVIVGILGSDITL